MFSFHKPRVYRSTEGCCICRAKSSSSRFTDSKKYEDDSMKCFNLEQPRKGEICNACVLLVKRFKRLPVGSNRHWGHVVDARIGPGLKSMSKFKKLKEDTIQQQQNSSENKTKLQNGKISSSIPEKFCKIFKKNKNKQLIKDKGKKVKESREGTPASWDEEQSLPPTPESFNSDCCEDTQFSNHINSLKSKNRMNRRKLRKPKKISNRHTEYVHFFDENDWKRLKSCCGVVFEHKQFGALIIDVENYKPCAEHISHLKDTTNTTNNVISVINGITNVAIDSTIVSDRIRKLHFTEAALDKPLKESIKEEQQQQPPFPALKKHHLFLKRQMENFPRMPDNLSVNLLKTDLIETTNNSNGVVVVKSRENDESCNTTATATSIRSSSSDTNYKFKTLHQIRSDTGKIVKHSVDKINMLCVKQAADLHEVKGLVKISDKTPLKSKFCAKLKISEVLHNKNVDPSNTKFSDNSSDSGFDENMLERKSSSPPGEEEKKILIQPVQTMFLASGVQICGQQQNLILTGNDVAARMLQQRQQTQIHTGTKAAQTTNGCQKVSAIFNQSADGLITLTGGSNITSMTNLTPSATSLNQKIILVKAKYNNNKPSTTN